MVQLSGLRCSSSLRCAGSNSTPVHRFDFTGRCRPVRPLCSSLLVGRPSTSRGSCSSVRLKHEGRTSTSSAAAAGAAGLPVQGKSPQQQQQDPAPEQVPGHHRNHCVPRTAYTFMAPNWEPLVGRSHHHIRVEKEVLKASKSSVPLFISGDAGLNTLRVAATVHALRLADELDASHFMVVVDCASAEGADLASQLLQGHCGDVTRQSGSHDRSQPKHIGTTQEPPLLSALTGGTLVLDNIHKAHHKLLALASEAVSTLLRNPQQQQQQQQQQPQDTPAAAAAAASGYFLLSHRTRLILVSQLPLGQLLDRQPGLAEVQSGSSLRDCPSIALPALRVRPSDIPLMAVAAGQATAVLRGYNGVQLTPAAEKQLTSYEFPANEAELQGLVQRAIMLHPPAPPATSALPAAAKAKEEGSLAGGFEFLRMGTNQGSAQAAGGHVLVLESGDFWAATGTADRERVDVLEVMPWLRKCILDTDFFPVGLRNMIAFMYPMVLLSLFLGPQDRESSAALTVFWAGWWPLVMLSFPFVGRAWCAICPFMITGEAAQNLASHDEPSSSSSSCCNGSSSTAAAATGTTTSKPPAPAVAAGSVTTARVWSASAAAVGRRLQRLSSAAAYMLPSSWQLQKWPRNAIEPWAGWFVVAAFAAILVWEEVWDLPGHADLSGWLLVLITSGAVACSVLFERRLWCRYLCPIGAMNGLFAKLSMTEIRNRPGLCAAAACSKPCHKGRVEHQTLQVPASNPAGSIKPFGLPVPSWLSSLTTCSSSHSSRNAPSSTVASPIDVSTSTNSCAGRVPYCSAFIDTAACCSFDTTVAAPSPSLSSAAAAASQDLVLVEKDVVFPGCPMNSSPGHNKDNSQCITCGNCLRSCSSGSAQWRLRPPAADLWQDHQASWTEVHLMNLLLGSVALHRLPQLCAQLGLPAGELLTQQGPHLLLSVALLAAPSALTWVFQQASAAALKYTSSSNSGSSSGTTGALATTPGRQSEVAVGASTTGEGGPWLKMSYAVLPLVWAGILAHYETLLLTELGLIAPRLAISLGVSATASWLSMLPTVGPASDDVIATAQGATLFIGTALSLALAGKIGAVELQQGRAAVGEVERMVVSQKLFTLLMAAELWHIMF